MYDYDRRQAAQEKIALRRRTLLTLMSKGRTFGVISAYGTGSKRENQTRHGELIADLQRSGLRKIETIRGQWEGIAEKAVLIARITPGLLFELGRKFDQDAVIYKSANGVLGMYNFRSMTAEIAIDPKGDPAFEMSRNPDLFSRVRRDWSFEFGFLWGQKVPWDGRTPISKKTVRQQFS